MDLIKDKEKYLEDFSGEASSTISTKHEEALKTALDTRKFEIELYWKRATYFWAFIAATFTAYFVLLTSDKVESHKHLTIIVSIIGYLFSLGWYLVNRGSKYWQENWERHVNNLEEKIQGPLFRIIKMPERNYFWKPLKGYPYSVSKVNQFLSLIFTMFWFGVFIYSLLFSYEKLKIVSSWLTIENTNIIFILWFLAIGIITFLILKYTQSFIVKDVKYMTKEERDDNIFCKK